MNILCLLHGHSRHIFLLLLGIGATSPNIVATPNGTTGIRIANLNSGITVLYLPVGIRICEQVLILFLLRFTRYIFTPCKRIDRPEQAVHCKQYIQLLNELILYYRFACPHSPHTCRCLQTGLELAHVTTIDIVYCN